MSIDPRDAIKQRVAWATYQLGCGRVIVPGLLEDLRLNCLDLVLGIHRNGRNDAECCNDYSNTK